MKTNIHRILAAASIVVSACTVELVPETSITDTNENAVVFTASFEQAPVPCSKAVLELNGSGKPQSFWEDGDAISVYSSGVAESGTVTSFKFITALESNSASATFKYAGEDAMAGGNYLATYPYREAARGVNFTVTPYRIAAVDVPENQTLIAGTFDRKASPAVAFASEGSSSLSFKNAAALLKFRVADQDVVNGRIEANAADAISGRFRADINAETMEPVLEKYSATGVAQHKYIDFTIDGSTPLSTGTDYYVAIRPTDLTSGLRIFLNDREVKTLEVSQIQRNKIYNLGTLSLPAAQEEKVLEFDFTVDPLEGWPTSGGDHHGKVCYYPLSGTEYSFILTDCEGATKCQTYWANNDPGNRLVLAAQYRYLGLPVISGYKLTAVKCVNIRLSASGTPANPKMGITHAITSSATAAAAEDYVSGGELQTWAGAGGGTYTYNLTGTDDATQYYIYALAKGAIATLTLTYVPI